MQLAPLVGAHAEAHAGAGSSDPELAGAIGLRRASEPRGNGEFVARSAAGKDTRGVRDPPRTAVTSATSCSTRSTRARRGLSIYIGEPDARGSGIGAAATRLALEEAFGPLGLSQVWLIVHARNEAAIRAYRAAGFIEENRRSDAFELGDERVDEVTMGVSREPRGETR